MQAEDELMEQAGVAMVTGAGSGIGRSAAVLLAEAGYAVVLVARTQENLQETAEQIAAAAPGVRTLTVAADLAEAGAAKAIMERTLATLGRVDVLCNVAGNAPLQPIEAITPEVWRRTIDINLSAPVLLTAAVWPTFQAQGSGLVVNLSSMSSIDPFRGFNIYAAAKVGLNMFTRCTADEGEAIGVKAVCLAPGAVETPMLRQNFSEDVLGKDRTLSPIDVAKVIRDCVTGARSFTSGETIVLPSP